MSWIDSALSVDSKMLLLRAKRAEVIAANLANADTPGYKARDVNFEAMLNDVRAGRTSIGASTDPGHFDFVGSGLSVTQRAGGGDSSNGNTVQREFEQSAFTQNSVQYLASLRFLNGSVQSIIGALRGE